MNDGTRLLAVIPARGGSKGLPGKNVLPLAGLPLIAHSILLAKMCPEIHRCIVSTDSEEIAVAARACGADVPFLRPNQLAQDQTPMWPVLQHALAQVEQEGQTSYDLLLLLDPTSPVRYPSDITQARQLLLENPAASGIVGVSQPNFNPIWHCVVEQDGWMTDLIEDGGKYGGRQEVPPVYRINGSLYLWRSKFVRACEGNWRNAGKHLIYEMPDSRAVSIDTPEEFDRVEFLIEHGQISLPWLAKPKPEHANN